MPRRDANTWSADVAENQVPGQNFIENDCLEIKERDGHRNSKSRGMVSLE